MEQTAKEKLLSLVERIEKLEEEKASTQEEIKSIYDLAKSDGYDAKVLRQVIRLRKKDDEERKAELDVLDVYMAALGMV
jgi:uncharacterized protein (UPF0335 family)